MPKKKQKDETREQYWRQLIDRQEKCGGSIAEFCRQEELRTSHFYWWRRELAVRDGKKPPATTNADAKRIEFLPVRLVEPESAAVNAGTAGSFEPIEIRVRGDLQIIVPGGANPLHLEVVIRGLRAG
jgi:hypothetical protein